MRRFLLIACIAIAVKFVFGPAASAAPPVVNPKLAKLQETVAKDMSDDTLNLDHAATVSAELLKADAGNALSHYAAARLAAWQEKWDDVLAHIEAGDKCAYTIHYQRVDGPDARYPLNPTLRQLARAVAEGAPKMGAERAAPLVKSFRTLSRKEAWSQPRAFLHVILASTLRNIVERPMPGLYAAGSPEAAAAQAQLDTDIAFLQSMKPDTDRYFGVGREPFFLAGCDRHRVTPEQVAAYHDGKKTDPAVVKRLMALKADFDKELHPVAARWLKKLPE